MIDKITLYEDENIEVYSDGIMRRINIKNDIGLEELLKDMALKYKYTADMFGLCLQSYNVNIDEFSELCHKIFGFYKRYNKKFLDEVIKSLENTEKVGNNE